MELRVLRYFLAVAREENISAAADYLHLTQPTLSRQLMDLEEELGKKLFLRGNRKITLTEDGVLFRRRASEILDLVEKTESEFRSVDEVVAGDIYIGGGESEAMRLVARTARALRERHPGIHYHLYSGNADDVGERLDKGLLDFGILIEPFDKKSTTPCGCLSGTAGGFSCARTARWPAASGSARKICWTNRCSIPASPRFWTASRHGLAGTWRS